MHIFIFKFRVEFINIMELTNKVEFNENTYLFM
jgi:hypothetical protein